jgi:hypothetical protein
MVPVRGLVAVFGAAVKVAVPLPDPLPKVIVSQLGSLVLAVQAQPLPAVTVTLPVPPAALTEWVAGDTV